MFGGIGDDLVKRLDEDFLARYFLPGLEHQIVDVVINGGGGGIMDCGHDCSGKFGERVAG